MRDWIPSEVCRPLGDTPLTSLHVAPVTGSRSCFCQANGCMKLPSRSHSQALSIMVLVADAILIGKSASGHTTLNTHIQTCQWACNIQCLSLQSCISIYMSTASQLKFAFLHEIYISLSRQSRAHSPQIIIGRPLRGLCAVWCFLRLRSSRINMDQFLLSVPISPFKLRHNGCSSPLDRCTLYLGFSDIFIKHLSMLED